MTNPLSGLVGAAASADADLMRPEPDETPPTFARPQDPPSPPAQPVGPAMLLAAAVNEGDPRVEDDPRRVDGAPYRD